MEKDVKNDIKRDSLEKDILTEVLAIVKETREDVSEVKTKVGSLETKVDSLETHVDSLETKVDSLETHVDSLETKVDSLETNVDSLKTQVDSLETQVSYLDAEVKTTKLVIENEIRPNIKEIAACHLDLSKKLDAVTASYESYSDLQIRVRVLESQMRELRTANLG